MRNMPYLATLEPNFVFGQSNEKQCDCLGLVLLYLRKQGFKCSWEPYVDREYTKYQLMESLLTSYGFRLVRDIKEQAPDFDCISCSFYRGLGHLGVYTAEDRYISSMGETGLRYLSADSLPTSYYIYQGD